MMFNRLLGEQLFNLLVRLQKLQGRLDNAVEEEGEVHEKTKADDLEPLESLPTKTK
jgi:hypothetical protein